MMQSYVLWHPSSSSSLLQLYQRAFCYPPSPTRPTTLLTTLLTPQTQRVVVHTGARYFRLVQRCIIWNHEPKFGSQLTAKVSDRVRFLFSTALYVQLQNARLCSSRAKSSLLRYIKRLSWRQSKMQFCSCSVLQDARRWTNVWMSMQKPLSPDVFTVSGSRGGGTHTMQPPPLGHRKLPSCRQEWGLHRGRPGRLLWLGIKQENRRVQPWSWWIVTGRAASP